MFKPTVVAVFTVAGLVLAACGSDDSGSSDTTAAGSTSDTEAAGSGEQVKLTLASWRTEDLAVWQDTILPAFETAHPNIDVEFAPTNTNDYNAAIQSQMDGGAGPDLITCRPYDVNRTWIEKGYFSSLAGAPSVSGFDANSLYPWAGADATPYCVPVASVLAGFFYNKDIFAELGLTVPTTQQEFIDTLQAIKDDGKYDPLALGSADSWQLAYNGLYSIGPIYWGGEAGRLGLIDGTKKVTDPAFVEAIAAFEAWKPFLPNGQAAIEYSDMEQLFTLGQAAILPNGSWDINQISTGEFEVGVFGPPVLKAGDQRYLQEQPDMAIGISAKSSHQAEAATFLEWIAGPEFAQLYGNAAPGFFSMSSTPVTYENALANEFAGLKDGAELTARLGLDQLSAGTPPFDDEVWRLLQLMMTTDDMTPEQVAQQLQDGLSSWYAPQQG
jgi:raffinose/stachyose/melibiose transport system substrate-binding protein